MSAPTSDVEEIRERAARLYALALHASDNNLNDHAAQLEQLAAEASEHADRLSSEIQQSAQQAAPRR